MGTWIYQSSGDKEIVLRVLGSSMSPYDSWYYPLVASCLTALIFWILLNYGFCLLVTSPGYTAPWPAFYHWAAVSLLYIKTSQDRIWLAQCTQIPVGQSSHYSFNNLLTMAPYHLTSGGKRCHKLHSQKFMIKGPLGLFLSEVESSGLP